MIFGSKRNLLFTYDTCHPEAASGRIFRRRAIYFFFGAPFFAVDFFGAAFFFAAGFAFALAFVAFFAILPS